MESDQHKESHLAKEERMSASGAVSSKWDIFVSTSSPKFREHGWKGDERFSNTEVGKTVGKWCLLNVKKVGLLMNLQQL